MGAILINVGTILINVGVILTGAILQWGDLTCIQTKDYEIGIGCLSTKHAALRSKTG